MQTKPWRVDAACHESIYLWERRESIAIGSMNSNFDSFLKGAKKVLKPELKYSGFKVNVTK